VGEVVDGGCGEKERPSPVPAADCPPEPRRDEEPHRRSSRCAWHDWRGIDNGGNPNRPPPQCHSFWFLHTSWTNVSQVVKPSAAQEYPHQHRPCSSASKPAKRSSMVPPCDDEVTPEGRAPQHRPRHTRHHRKKDTQDQAREQEHQAGQQLNESSALATKVQGTPRPRRRRGRRRGEGQTRAPHASWPPPSA
jgi:hypothetical protein